MHSLLTSNHKNPRRKMMTDAEYLEMLEAEHSMRCNDPDLFDEINEFEDMEDFE